MNLLILRTNIDGQKLNRIAPVLNFHSSIRSWNIDTSDIDNVLRIEAEDTLREQDVIQLVQCYGFVCEELED